MPQVNETGHTKNVSTFYSLVGFAKGWGKDYQPTNPILALDNLGAMHPKCETAVKEADDADKNFSDLVDKRMAVFQPLQSYATRIVNTFAALDLPKETIAGAKEINRKIQGKRATPKAAVSTEPKDAATVAADKKSISSSQMSYDNNVKHLNDLRAWVEMYPEYNPNEQDLTIEAIKDYCSKLDLSNKAVLDGLVPYQNKLDARDLLLYADKTGMVDMALFVKKYAKGAFGATSPKYKQVSGLTFRKLARKK